MSINSTYTKSLQKHVNLTKINKTLLIALQMGTFTCASAFAQEVTISEDRNTSIETATADGGSPADIIIDNDGKIEVSDGTAITINSDNDLDMDGNVLSQGFDNAIGIHIDTQGAGTITSNLNINDGFNIGSTDGNDNVGTGNYGILVSGDGDFIGDIILGSSGNIDVLGNNSAGFSLQTDMVGNVQLDNIGISGENSVGAEILGTLDGNLITNSNITIREAGSYGVYIGGDITGSYNNRGSITAGADSTFNFFTQTQFDAKPGEAAIRISGNVGGGFENRIIYFDSLGGVVEVNEGDSIAGLSSDTSSLLSYAGGYALLVTPEKLDSAPMSDITLGNTESFYGDYSIMNQGDMAASGANKGVDSTAVLITGAVDGLDTYSTTLTHGFYNGLWGKIESEAEDGTAKGVEFGDYSSAPEFINNGIIEISTTTSFDDTTEVVGPGGDAYGLLINPDASIDSFENRGTITVSAEGANTSAYGVIDNSGTITNFYNTNIISTVIDEESTGDTVAVDLSANNTVLTFHSEGIITGDVYLGSGDNTITLDGLTTEQIDLLTQAFIDDNVIEEVYLPLLERKIEGSITLGGGTATLELNNNANLTQGIYSPNGQLEVTMNDQSQMTVPADRALNVENMYINDSSKLTVEVNGQGTFEGGINATGDIIFGENSELKIQIDSLIGGENSFEVISANSLTIDSETNLFNESDQLFIYDIQSEIDATSLNVSLRRKTAEELNLSNNVGNIYEASVPVLIASNEVGGAISSIIEEEEFNRVYSQMMPSNLTQATRQILINNNSLAIGAVSGQLDNLRRLKYIGDDKMLSGNGLWVQQYGSKYDLDADYDKRSANGFTFGIAAGYDFAIGDRAAVGVSVARNFADIKFDNAGGSRMGMENTQLGVYGALWLKDFFVEGQANVGMLDFESDRDVVFSNFTRTAEADWGGLHYASNLKAGYQLNMGSFTLTPSASINYNNAKHNAYTETGGGTGIDLEVSEYRTSSMIGNLKAELTYQVDLSTENDTLGNLMVGLHGGWLKEIKDDPNQITAKFAGFGNEFTLEGSPISQNGYQAGLGVYFITDITNFSIIYDADWKDNYMAHTATMNFRVRF